MVFGDLHVGATIMTSKTWLEDIWTATLGPMILIEFPAFGWRNLPGRCGEGFTGDKTKF